MISRKHALAIVCASLLGAHLAGCALSAPEVDDAASGEPAAVVIDAADFATLKPGERLMVDFTSGGPDTTYRVNFQSMADLERVQVISEDGSYLLADHVEAQGGLVSIEAGESSKEAMHSASSSPDGCVCVAVCCWHWRCYCDQVDPL